MKPRSKHIVVSYFEPFGEVELNSSKLSLEYWFKYVYPLRKNNFTAEIIELPVVFGDASQLLQSRLNSVQWDGLLMFGQAERRKKISLEQTAKNVVDPRIADNAGKSPQGKIDPQQPENLNSTWNYSSIIKSLPLEIFELSDNAGEYVCNELFFRQLCFEKSKPTGFVHLPLVEPQKNFVFFLEETAFYIHRLMVLLTDDLGSYKVKSDVGEQR